MAGKALPRLVDSPRLCHCGDHGFVSLTKGYMTMVSPQDMEILGRGYWQAHPKPRAIYVIQTSGTGKRIGLRLHRVILNAPDDVEVDHKDRNGLDNRRHNLREATHTQNNQNRMKAVGKTSKYFGVHWVARRNAWIVGYILNKKRIFVGRFDDETDAARAYDAAILKSPRASFSRLNFPQARQVA